MAILKSSKAGTSFDTKTGIRTNLDRTTTQIQDTVNPETGTISSNDTPIVTPTELKVGTSFVTKETTPTSTVSSPTLTPLQTAEQDIQNKKSSSQSEYEKLLADVGLIKGKEGGYQEELGATQAKEAYTNYVNQLEQEKRALELRKRDLFSQGLTKTQAQNFYDAEERQSLQKQADIAILGNAAMGKYNFALDEAKRKVDLELKPLEDELALKKQQYEDNKDMLSIAEKAKLTSLYKREEDDLATQRKEKEMIATLSVTAAQNGAGFDVLKKLGEAKTYNEALQIAARYTTDPLDKAIKLAQISKLQAEAKTEKAKTEQPKSSASQSVVDVVNSLLNNPSLSKISGLSGQYLGGVSGKAALAKNEFNQLKGMLSLQNRQQLKGSGAISDFEFKVLTQAASALDRNLTDEDFKSELEKLRNQLSPEYNYVNEISSAIDSNIDSTGTSIQVNDYISSLNIK